MLMSLHKYTPDMRSKDFKDLSELNFDVGSSQRNYFLTQYYRPVIRMSFCRDKYDGNTKLIQAST